jgi:hypothetical protein
MPAVFAPHELHPRARRAGHGFQARPAKLALGLIAGYGAAAIWAIQGFYIHGVQVKVNNLLYEIEWKLSVVRGPWSDRNVEFEHKMRQMSVQKKEICLCFRVENTHFENHFPGKRLFSTS